MTHIHVNVIIIKYFDSHDVTFITLSACLNIFRIYEKQLKILFANQWYSQKTFGNFLEFVLENYRKRSTLPGSDYGFEKLSDVFQKCSVIYENHQNLLVQCCLYW